MWEFLPHSRFKGKTRVHLTLGLKGGETRVTGFSVAGASGSFLAGDQNLGLGSTQTASACKGCLVTRPEMYRQRGSTKVTAAADLQHNTAIHIRFEAGTNTPPSEPCVIALSRTVQTVCVQMPAPVLYTPEKPVRFIQYCITTRLDSIT